MTKFSKSKFSDFVRNQFAKFTIFSILYYLDGCRKLHFPYSTTCYKFYEEKLVDNFQPIIEGICKSLKRITLPEDRFQRLPEHEEVNMGTTLFEVYLVLKRFELLGSGLSCENTDFKLNNFHEWFTGGVTHWLDISVYKALIRYC